MLAGEKEVYFTLSRVEVFPSVNEEREERAMYHEYREISVTNPLSLSWCV